MRIHQPHIGHDDGRATLRAEISTDREDLNHPGHLYFSTSSTGAGPFSDKADAFVTGLLPVAMMLGESLDVDAPVSTRLAHGLEHYQDILTTWWPHFFQRVDIHYARLSDYTDAPRPKGVGCTFSGGVDSFQAVADLRMPGIRFPEFAITHALMINGFDQVMDLDHRGASQQMNEVYSRAMAQWGIELVMLDTNLKVFKQSVMNKTHLWATYGGSLAACGHALGPMFGRFNIPAQATYAHEDLRPVGSHPILDPLLSTDQFEVIHTGARRPRAAKLEALADEPVFRDNLRVCFRNPEFDAVSGAVVNCGKCEKCIRTIVSLDVLGRLDEFPTFPKRPPMPVLQNSQVLVRIPTIFLKDILSLAERRGRSRWADVLRQALELRSAKFGDTWP